jgi:hypothetical protein
MIIVTNKITLRDRSMLMLIDTLMIRFLSVLTIFINCSCREIFRDSLNIQLLSWLNVWWFSKKWRCYRNRWRSRCKDKCKDQYRNRCKNWCRCKCENWRNKEFDRCEFDWCDSSFSLKCVSFKFVLSISNDWKQFTIISFHVSDLIRCSVLMKWFFDESIH